ELSITGFDDIELARHLRPALTTLRVPTQSLWHLVADRLIAGLAGLAGEAMPAATAVEVELCVRDSTGPAPRR
ncbi:MAG: substrate-binding domain-containing protein, partial [Burkholderiales bacterium]|nr:substrate-binding domain-containing protein [Burkholderiales bacterium]